MLFKFVASEIKETFVSRTDAPLVGTLISIGDVSVSIPMLFRERLSEKVHETIPKGIVGGFQFTALGRNLRPREAMDVCLRVLKESNKSRFDSYSRSI